MPSTPSAPRPPDPEKVAAAQYKYGLKTQQGNLVNQQNPYGSLTYDKTIDPVTGVPVYTSHTNLNSTQQGIFDNQQNVKTLASHSAGSILGNMSSTYDHLPDFSNQAGGLTKQLLDQETSYLDPVYKRQKDQLDNKLINQGLTPDSPAYKNQMMDLQRNQNDSITHFLANNEPQAFDQVVRQYNIPLETAGKLASLGAPGSAQHVDTGAARTSPVDYAGIANQGYQNAMSNYNAQVGAGNNTMGSIGSIAGSALGTAVLGPIGTAIGGGLGNMAGSMFGGSGGSYQNSWAPQVWQGS